MLEFGRQDIGAIYGNFNGVFKSFCAEVNLKETTGGTSMIFCMKFYFHQFLSVYFEALHPRSCSSDFELISNFQRKVSTQVSLIRTFLIDQ